MDYCIINMLNAVDINQFLSNELSSTTDVGIAQLIQDAMAMSTARSQLLAQETVDHRMGLYCFGVSTHMIGLFDSGNGKKLSGWLAGSHGCYRCANLGVFF